MAVYEETGTVGIQFSGGSIVANWLAEQFFGSRNSFPHGVSALGVDVKFTFTNQFEQDSSSFGRILDLAFPDEVGILVSLCGPGGRAALRGV